MPTELVRAQRSGVRTENTLGRYQLVAALGQGGMGTIHLAVAGGLADFRKLLVVKELRQDLAVNRRFVEMFFDEAKLAARLSHPNVVQTIEAGQQGDRYFLSMEFLDGQPYNAIWQAAGQFPQVSLPLRLKILCEALAGLHYAHTLTEYDGSSLHIVHRDVSPQNIFVTYDGQVKVVDFGIAKAAVSTAFTAPGVFKGKFGYAAPEQVRGDDVDARTDIFAMGVILWETLAMQRFCDGAPNRAAVATRLGGQEPRASQIRPKVDPRLASICDRALAVTPTARFATADEMRVALEDYLAQSGQRVDAATIKQVLAQKFAAERRAIHGLIDRHIKHGVVEESHVHTVTLGSEAGNNQPTQVADLMQYVRSTTHETVVSGAPLAFAPAPPARSRRMIIVCAVAAAAALALTLALVQLSGSEEQITTSPVEPRPPAPGAALQPQAAESKPLAPRAAAARPEAPVAQITPDARPAAGARPAAYKPARARAAAPVAEPLDTEQPAQPPVEAPAARVEPPAPKPVEKVSVGADLNSVEKSHQRRDIDTEL